MLRKVVMYVFATLVTSMFIVSAQADDVSISNHSKETVRFRVVVPCQSDKTFYLAPKQTENALGRDLWHDAVVNIYGTYPDTGAECALSVHQQLVFGTDFFYLPHVSAIHGYPPCPYTSNLPNCDCFGGHSDWCRADCVDVSNAQVFVYVD